LASLILSKYAKKREDMSPYFDFQELFEASKRATINLNKVIDRNHYPVPEAEKSNIRHRPIGLGVQALADVFIMMRYPFESKEAAQLNKDIFETIYFGAITASNELAQKDGHYETYPGSPWSKGIFHFDQFPEVVLSGRWDWASLKEKVARWGVRNSLHTAVMPTASTAQIARRNESIEPFTLMVYKRETLSGEFQMVCQHLVKDLTSLGLWSNIMKDRIITNKGSIQGFMDIPEDIRMLYKTAFEIEGKVLIDLAADRQPFIDQSQSLNCFMKEPTRKKVTAMHFYAWKKGLKSCMYYLHSQVAAIAAVFTADKEKLDKEKKKEDESSPTQEEIQECSLKNKEDCVMCSS
jgi:ribonucleoside-diphosphate reductase alpha chain